jgi:hypothetical protein
MKSRTLIMIFAAVLPAMAAGQTTSASPESGPWEITVGLYGYLPAINGTVNFPNDMGSTDIHVPFSDLWDHLKMVAVGFVDVRKDRWGGFTDALYMDVGGAKSVTHDFQVGGSTVQGTVDLNLDVKAVVWTLAGEYQVVSDPKWRLDAFAGARMLYGKIRLGYAAGQIVGTKESSATLWDGIVGIKGRYGEKYRWFVPFYLDVGTGATKLTWQGSGGIGYSWRHFEVVAVWRYLEWTGKSGRPIADINFSGPEVGFAYRF